MRTTTMLALVGLASLACTTACERKAANTTPAQGTTTAANAPAVLPANFFLPAAPAEAKPVEEVKKTAKVGDTVAISGRVGGSSEPFVNGRAVFTLVGPGIPACSDTPGDACEKPWDYCCEKKEDIAAHSATIQVVDSGGRPLNVNMKGEHGIKELSDMVIVGKVAAADGPNLVVNASNIYVK